MKFVLVHGAYKLDGPCPNQKYMTENAGRILDAWLGRAFQQILQSVPYQR